MRYGSLNGLGLLAVGGSFFLSGLLKHLDSLNLVGLLNDSDSLG